MACTARLFSLLFFYKHLQFLYLIVNTIWVTYSEVYRHLVLPGYKQIVNNLPQLMAHSNRNVTLYEEEKCLSIDCKLDFSSHNMQCV